MNAVASTATPTTVVGRDALAQHITSGEGKFNACVSLRIGRDEIIGTLVSSVDNAGVCVELFDGDTVEIFSPRFNNMTAHDFVSLEYLRS